MTSSDDRFSEDTCREDRYTLHWMTEHFDFPVELIRRIQKRGLMLSEIVKFGSVEIEICSGLDQTMFRRFMDTLDEHGDFSKAMAEAEAYIADIYRVAHGEAPLPMNDSPESGPLAQRLRRKKLYLKHELQEALSISEDRYKEILQEIYLVPVRLQIPGTTIEYYIEDDYLSLRYVLTLLWQGHSLESAVDKAFDWRMFDVGGRPLVCSPWKCPLRKEERST